MFLLSCLLSLAVQAPPGAEDAFARLGLEADLTAAMSGWRPPRPRWPEVAAPALARRITAAPREAVVTAEAFVRAALSEIRPVPLLRAGAQAFGGAARDLDARAPARMDIRRFEDVLERAHREIVQALGSGRDPALLAPALQAAIERCARGGRFEQVGEDEVSSLRTALGRAAKVDYAVLTTQAIAIVAAAHALSESGEVGTLADAATKPGERGVTGSVLFDRTMQFGRFVIGGTGRNEYECAQLAVIVDLGGDDEYRGPAAGVGVARRMSLVLDLEGNDVYRAENDGLGCGVFGVGILVDRKGNDRYHGAGRCAGFGAGGIGALFDLGGDDEFTLAHDSGGVGFLGIGLCLDAGAGKDVTAVGPRSLGCGLPGGLGFFVDDGGDDARLLVVGEAPGPMACGVGMGVPGWLAGGLGLFVDVDGTDDYRGGDSACGAGIGGGVGICFDAAGVDHYALGELSLGGGRDHGIGVFVDAAGDDHYRSTGASLGCAFGFALGWGEDRAGRDEYDLTGTWPGHADAGAVGAFFDFAGRDRYALDVRPPTWRDPTAERAKSLGLFEDRGGETDEYVGGEGVRSPRQNEVDRHVGSGAAGEVVRAFVDG
jgi:hypothetical protein